jgi:hypothetical protein
MDQALTVESTIERKFEKKCAVIYKTAELGVTLIEA